MIISEIPRLLAATAASLVLAAPATAAAGLADARPHRISAACPAGPGVTVVVDFGALGGTDVRCAPQDVDTGLDALELAGFDWVGTAQFSDFVCRINGLPTVADDPCVRTPPADAYWSYWTAARGGTWAYRSQSAGSVDPPAGSVEGWAFGAGDPPGIAPSAPPADPPPPPPPPPTSTSAPLPTQTSDDDDGDDGDDGQVTSNPVSSATSTASPTTSAPTRVPTTPGRTSARTELASTSTAEPLGSGGDGEPGGSATGTVVGLVAAAALAAAGGVIVLRRRGAFEGRSARGAPSP